MDGRGITTTPFRGQQRSPWLLTTKWEPILQVPNFFDSKKVEVRLKSWSRDGRRLGPGERGESSTWRIIPGAP